MIDIISITKDDLPGIQRTLASTRGLRRRCVRQIVIDSSTPGTREHVEAAASQEANVDYVWQAPAGISSAFNEGLRRSSALWIWYLNGGDTAHLQLDVQLFLSLLEASTADVLIFELEYQSGVARHPPLYALWPPVFNWIPHPATITRRSALMACGGFDESYRVAMDGELWLRLLGGRTIVDLISFPIAKFAPGGASESSWTAVEVKRLIQQHHALLIRRWLASGRAILSAWRHFRRVGRSTGKAR